MVEAAEMEEMEEMEEKAQLADPAESPETRQNSPVCPCGVHAVNHVPPLPAVHHKLARGYNPTHILDEANKAQFLVGRARML